MKLVMMWRYLTHRCQTTPVEMTKTPIEKMMLIRSPRVGRRPPSWGLQMLKERSIFLFSGKLCVLQACQTTWHRKSIVLAHLSAHSFIFLNDPVMQNVLSMNKVKLRNLKFLLKDLSRNHLIFQKNLQTEKIIQSSVNIVLIPKYTVVC